MKWLIDSFFDFLFDSMGIIFVIALIIGFAGFLWLFEYPFFPLGSSICFCSIVDSFDLLHSNCFR